MFPPRELIQAVWTRPPRARERAVRPGPWRILTGLLRDGGILNSREAPRTWRWLALGTALLYQGLWCLMLLWLVYVRFLVVPLAAHGEGGGHPGEVIEVTFIDPAPPRQVDAEYWPTPLPEPLPEPLPARVPTPPEPLPQPTPAATVPLPRPTPPDPAPVPISPLMVTEVDEPDSDFTLPVPEFQRPAPDLPVPPAAQRELRMAEVPLLQRPDHPLPAPPAQFLPPTVELSAPERPLPEREIPAPLNEPTLHLQQIPEMPAPDLAGPRRDIREREIPAPLTAPRLRPLPAPELTSPELASEQPRIHEREIPVPLTVPELRPSLPPASLPPVDVAMQPREISPREIALTVPAASPPVVASTSIPPAQAETIREIDLTPASALPPGSTRSDAWDVPARSPEKSSSGLLDAQGRPRLPGGSTGAGTGGGLPPGTLVEDYANIDRMGSWLKRPLPGYQPGPLDQLWVPHEDILQEWVRRSIKNIWIPIPGTGKAIRCTVVLLMLGGGCGIADPNLMDIEAGARPPPDIPFKPELHEDQRSLGAPDTGADNGPPAPAM